MKHKQRLFKEEIEMNKKLQHLSLAAVLATSTAVLSTNASAEATLSGNAGILSEYIFRGIVQNDTASGNGGIDFGHFIHH